MASRTSRSRTSSFRQIAFGIGTKNLGIRGVGGTQRVADIGDIDPGVDDGLPGMRIGIRAYFERRDTIGRGHDHRLAACGLHQPRQLALQAKAVDDHELRVRNLLGVRRRRRIDVRVAVGADQCRDVDALATDIA